MPALPPGARAILLGTAVIAFVADPDGYKIEFIQKKEQSGAPD